MYYKDSADNEDIHNATYEDPTAEIAGDNKVLAVLTKVLISRTNITTSKRVALCGATVAY